MSDSEDETAKGAERRALSRLEELVGQMLEDRARLGRRAERSDARVQDLESLLRRFTKGEVDPAALQARIADLEEENESLKARLRDGREGVDRLLSQIRFLEDRR